jgi:hypothetical protein
MDECCIKLTILPGRCCMHFAQHLYTHMSLKSQGCAGMGGIIRWLVTLHLYTSQYKTLCTDKEFIYSLITRQYIHWVALLLLSTKQSDRQVIKPRTKSGSFWSNLPTPAPICRGCRLSLSRPLHSQPSGSPFGTNSIEKGHVSGALFSPTDLTQWLHVAIRMSRITKKSR